MAKRIYWINVSESFFDSKVIRQMLSRKGGYTMLYIYQRLLLLAAATDGRYMLHDNHQTMYAIAKDIVASIDEENVWKVGEALSYFLDNGLMDVDWECGSLFFPQAAEIVNSECDSASRVRAFRRRHSMEYDD